MRPGYVAALVFTWVTCSIMGLVIEWGQLGSTQQNLLAQVLGFQSVTSQQTWGAAEVLMFLPNFFTSLYQMLTFQYAFLDGSFVIVMWIVLAPFYAPIIFGMIAMFVTIFRYVFS